MEKLDYKENSKKIEKWAKNFWANEPADENLLDKNKEKMVILDFFPYPSGIGLHIGHTLGYIATDIYARYNRLKGKNVLFAMGFDSFGLPAEQFAIDSGIHPKDIIKTNIDNMKKQLAVMALSHDEARSFSTTDTDYYKWTQWIFIKIYESYFDTNQNKAVPIENLIQNIKDTSSNQSRAEIENIINKRRLTYIDDVEVNWCPALGTVLSNEEVINEKSERGGHPVLKTKMKQWVMRITEYAERLVDNLKYLDWPENVKEMQRNWIGLSKGYLIKFKIDNPANNTANNTQMNKSIEVFTTKPETLAGVTFLAISIEHPDVEELCENNNELKNELKNELERCRKNKEASIPFILFTQLYAKHPITNESLPIYIADYVLNYGARAVMGVPFHDERDNKCAIANNLPIKQVMKYSDSPYNYDNFNNEGKSIKEITEEYVANNIATPKTFTKLKDWIFSRQRYWGEPFPIIFDENGAIYEVDELPVILPDINLKKLYSDISDKAAPPLDKAAEWKNIYFIKLDEYKARIVNLEDCPKDCPEDYHNRKYKYNDREYDIYKGTRETNTMPNWAGSCWYYLRYMDSKNNEAFVSSEAMKYWGTPQKFGYVDLYLGGTEHAVLHLLYARFWHMVLYDLGLVNSPEPFQRLFNQGMVQGPAYSDSNGKYYDPMEIVRKSENNIDKFYTQDGRDLQETIGKIGKRYKNGVPPEKICDLYSADTLRLYMMYLGPLEQSKPWSYVAINGMSRLLEKVLNLKIAQDKNSKASYKFNNMLAKITDHIENLKYNVAIAEFIIFINEYQEVDIEIYKKLIVIFSVFAPHLSEYLYNQHFKGSCKGNLKGGLKNENWPQSEITNYTPEMNDVVITVNGKKREVKKFKIDISDCDLIDFANNFCKSNNIEQTKIILIRNTNNNAVKLINIIANAK